MIGRVRYDGLLDLSLSRDCRRLTHPTFCYVLLTKINHVRRQGGFLRQSYFLNQDSPEAIFPIVTFI
jgi:hypothetical protein